MQKFSLKLNMFEYKITHRMRCARILHKLNELTKNIEFRFDVGEMKRRKSQINPNSI